MGLSYDTLRRDVGETRPGTLEVKTGTWSRGSSQHINIVEFLLLHPSKCKGRLPGHYLEIPFPVCSLEGEGEKEGEGVESLGSTVHFFRSDRTTCPVYHVLISCLTDGRDTPSKEFSL